MRALAAVAAFLGGVAGYLYAYQHGIPSCGWVVIAGVVVAVVLAP